MSLPISGGLPPVPQCCDDLSTLLAAVLLTSLTEILLATFSVDFSCGKPAGGNPVDFSCGSPAGDYPVASHAAILPVTILTTSHVMLFVMYTLRFVRLFFVCMFVAGAYALMLMLYLIFFLSLILLQCGPGRSQHH